MPPAHGAALHDQGQAGRTIPVQLGYAGRRQGPDRGIARRRVRSPDSDGPEIVGTLAGLKGERDRPRHVQYDVGPLRRGEQQVLQGSRYGERHPVMGHNLAGSPADAHREHPRSGRIDQPQANPVAAPDRVPGEQGPGDVAHPPGMGEVVPVAETLVQFAAAFQAPVVKNDRNVMVDGGRVRLLDDQGAVETLGNLFPGPVVGAAFSRMAGAAQPVVGMRAIAVEAARNSLLFMVYLRTASPAPW